MRHVEKGHLGQSQEATDPNNIRVFGGGVRGGPFLQKGPSPDSSFLPSPSLAHLLPEAYHGDMSSGFGAVSSVGEEEILTARGAQVHGIDILWLNSHFDQFEQVRRGEVQVVGDIRTAV